MTKESFLRGAAILAAASAVNRLIGLVYMVALPRLIFDEGMGLYQLVKPIHYFAAVVAIGGMPVGIAKLIAEKAALGSAQEVKRVFRTGLLLLLISGGVVALALSLGAPWFAKVLAKDAGGTPTLRALGPACFFLALSAGFGVFSGPTVHDTHCHLPGGGPGGAGGSHHWPQPLLSGPGVWNWR
jgi:O-antigen/teichoic acid export membrane protein